jgi:type II secretory pathway pseudopilin PulG
MFQMSCRTRPIRAFSMIELLVVTSLLGLLIALLMPALARARQAMQDGQCLVNLRQIGIATAAYSHDARGYLPARHANEAASPHQGIHAWRHYSASGSDSYYPLGRLIAGAGGHADGGGRYLTTPSTLFCPTRVVAESLPLHYTLQEFNNHFEVLSGNPGTPAATTYAANVRQRPIWTADGGARGRIDRVFRFNPIWVADGYSLHQVGGEFGLRSHVRGNEPMSWINMLRIDGSTATRNYRDFNPDIILPESGAGRWKANTTEDSEFWKRDTSLVLHDW